MAADRRRGGQYKIVNKNSGLLLGVAGMSTSDSANVVQYSDNGTADHLWTLRSAATP
ncbi:RICIN domain-containing protein [Streptomyces kaempferi]